MHRLAEETRRLARDKNSAAAGTYCSNLSLFLFLGGEVIVAAGSRKVFAISAMQAQEQRVSRRCTPAGVATPFHLGLRLLPFYFFFFFF